jgi:hypothetical protein
VLVGIVLFAWALAGLISGAAITSAAANWSDIAAKLMLLKGAQAWIGGGGPPPDPT